MNKVKLFNILIVCCGLCACATKRELAEVIDHRQPPSTKVGHHVVAPGETLYSIAWRYNLDYKKLSKFNGIGRNYAIYPGQRIILKEAQSGYDKPAKPSYPSTNSSSKTRKIHTQVATSDKAKSLKKKPIVVKNKPPVKSRSTKLLWSWPSNGALISRYQGKSGLNKGIDIAGKLGEPVLAASSGTVVYAGDGLRGYGKLLIIKHSEKYLSAYAHNRRLLVREGDKVVRNDKIAEMGKSGADRVKLHFEIRYDGKPIDPLAYLPTR